MAGAIRTAKGIIAAARRLGQGELAAVLSGHYRRVQLHFNGAYNYAKPHFDLYSRWMFE